jgi:hypothetical protein
LKTDGVFLDVHPQPENSEIEIWQNGRIRRLGEINQSEDHAEIEAARVHLDSFRKGGLFVEEQHGFFELLEHHPTVEHWQDNWADNGYRLLAEPSLLKSAKQLLRSGGGELVVREPVRATALQRLDPNSQTP